MKDSEIPGTKEDLDELSKEEVVKLLLSSMHTTYWVTMRAVGFIRSGGIDKEVVQALFEMEDETIDMFWECSPDMELIQVKREVKHSDN